MVTFVAPVHMTVPVTDKKHPTSLDLGIESLVISGHTGKPENTRECNIKKQDLKSLRWLPKIKATKH